MNTQTLTRPARAAMAVRVTGTVHFMDGTRLVLQWPRQAGEDPGTIAGNIRKALEADKIVAEVDGELLLIPARNIKYIHVTPAPEKLPQGVILGAKLLD